MKPPPTVEEIIEVMHDALGRMTHGEDEDSTIARAILARVRESVPHISLWRRVLSHTHPHADYCADQNGACAWEEPR